MSTPHAKLHLNVRGGVLVARGSMRLALVLLACALAFSQAASGQTSSTPSPPPAQPPKMVTAPDWIRKPSSEDLMRYFPVEAMRARKSGKAVMQCTTNTTGLLSDCVVISEEPRDLGFGTTALAVASIFKMRPPMVDGQPQKGTVNIPMIFDCSNCGSYSVSAKPLTTYLRPTWTAAPNFEQWKAAYPEAARRAGLEGGASLECAIKADGGLRGCKTTNQYPPNMGFGAAAMSLAPFFRTKVTDADGTSRRGAMLILKVAWTSAALSQDKPIGAPRFVSGPDQGNAAAAFPKKAKDAGVTEGKARIACDLGLGGALTNCSIRDEAPADVGFGQAALALAPDYRFNLWGDDGIPVARRIAIPMSFGARLETLELSSLVRTTEALVGQGKQAQAKLVADEIKRRFPNDPAGAGAVRMANYVPRKFEASRFNSSCWDKAKKGDDLKGALADCDKALALEPDWPAAFDSRGFANLKAGDFKQAAADFDRAVTLNPDDAHSLYGRGLAKLKAGDSTGAADVEAALKIDDKIAGIYAGYGIQP